MQRSWEIIEKILEVAESFSSKEICKKDYLLPFMGREVGADSDYEELLTYNIKLLAEEKYINANMNNEDSIGRLSWRGHNLLEDIRRNTFPLAARS